MVEEQKEEERKLFGLLSQRGLSLLDPFNVGHFGLDNGQFVAHRLRCGAKSVKGLEVLRHFIAGIVRLGEVDSIFWQDNVRWDSQDVLLGVGAQVVQHLLR